MTDTVVVFLEGGLVNDVSNMQGESIPYLVVDHDAWENNECPICRGDGIKLEGAAEINGYHVGGTYWCPTCGTKEYMDGKDMIKILERLDDKGGL